MSNIKANPHYYNQRHRSSVALAMCLGDRLNSPIKHFINDYVQRTSNHPMYRTVGVTRDANPLHAWYYKLDLYSFLLELLAEMAALVVALVVAALLFLLLIAVLERRGDRTAKAQQGFYQVYARTVPIA